MELRRTFADNTRRIFRAAHQHFHRRVFERLAGTGKAFFYHKANGRKLLRNRIGNGTFFAKQFITEKLNLVTVTELIKRHAGESIRCPIHNAKSLSNPQQRSSFFISSI